MLIREIIDLIIYPHPVATRALRFIKWMKLSANALVIWFRLEQCTLPKREYLSNWIVCLLYFSFATGKIIIRDSSRS
jgi:hypothetical protein